MHDVVLTHRLRDALRWLNPQCPERFVEEALLSVTKDRSVMDRVRANREIYDLLRDGYRAEWRRTNGERRVRDGSLRRLPRPRRRTTGWLRRRCG